MSYFLEVWPALHDFWEREFKFKPPSRVRFIDKSESEASASLAARFGLYANSESYDILTQHYGASPVHYDREFRSQLWGGKFTFPIALSSYACSQRRQHIHSHAYFLLDPQNLFDVVDFWNLRAAGMILVPLTLGDYEDFEMAVREVAGEAVYPINESITNYPVLIKGRSIEEEQLDLAAWQTTQRANPPTSTGAASLHA